MVLLVIRGYGEGLLAQDAPRILSKLLRQRDRRVSGMMTPRTAIFALPEDLRVADRAVRSTAARPSAAGWRVGAPVTAPGPTPR